MIWPDDDFGYVRQLSNPQERERPGGAGVYYHNVFWGPPDVLPVARGQRSLADVGGDDEGGALRRAGSGSERRLHQTRRDPEPALPAMAFDAEAFRDSRSVGGYLRNWAADAFGPENADAITRVLCATTSSPSTANPEFMRGRRSSRDAVRQTRFNMLDFGDENARRAAAYREIMAETDAIAARLSRTARPPSTNSCSIR